MNELDHDSAKNLVTVAGCSVEVNWQVKWSMHVTVYSVNVCYS